MFPARVNLRHILSAIIGVLLSIIQLEVSLLENTLGCVGYRLECAHPPINLLSLSCPSSFPIFHSSTPIPTPCCHDSLPVNPFRPGHQPGNAFGTMIAGVDLPLPQKFHDIRPPIKPVICVDAGSRDCLHRCQDRCAISLRI